MLYIIDEPEFKVGPLCTDFITDYFMIETWLLGSVFLGLLARAVESPAFRYSCLSARV